MPMIEIKTLEKDATFQSYLAQPSGAPHGAIVVIQEIFGVNAGIRRKCDLLAEEGFLAIAPDLFWRLEPGVELNPDVPEQFEQALALMNRFDQDQGVKDIEAAIRAARSRLSDGGKVGAVGYCLGGRLAFMTAARTDVDASVAYYPVGIPNLLSEKHAIANPLLIHVAGEDHFVDKAMQAEMHADLDDHPRVTLFDYPSEDHGFAAEMGKRRSEAAAALADRRTLDFFAAHVG